MKVFVLGAQGQMGSAAVASAQAKGLSVTALGHRDADVTDEASLHQALLPAQPGDVIINAAALLGTREAETDPLAQLEVNVHGAIRVALAARKRNAAIVHFSTDYVFDGAKEAAYVESDRPNPLNMYGSLKLASELLVRTAHPEHYILRVSSLFGGTNAKLKSRNFVERMLQAGSAAKTVEARADLIMSPTYSHDAADLALELVRLRASYGLYHGSNMGACSWLEFTQAIFDLSGLDSRAVPLNVQDDPVVRPRNSALRSEKLEALGMKTRPWREALAAYLMDRESRRHA